MEFSVNSKVLLQNLILASGAIGKNPVLPIMEDFLFELHGEILTITATDLESTIICKVKVDGRIDGTIAIPANTILQTLKSMNDIVLTISVDKERQSVEIISLTGNYKCTGDNAADFPNSPDMDDANSIIVKTADIKRGISNTVFATSGDELRLAMTGIFFNVSSDGLYMVATDAHQLVEYKIKDTFSINQSVIIPGNACKNIENMLTPEYENVTISITKNNIFFEVENIKLIVRLIDSKFPEYKGVIPVNNDLSILVSKKDLLNSIKRTLIYTNKSTNQVIFDIKNNHLEISTHDYDLGKECKEKITLEESNIDEFSISYNAKMMAAMINVIELDHIELKLKEPSKASIIDVEHDTYSIKFLLMPVLISR